MQEGVPLDLFSSSNERSSSSDGEENGLVEEQKGLPLDLLSSSNERSSSSDGEESGSEKSRKGVPLDLFSSSSERSTASDGEESGSEKSRKGVPLDLFSSQRKHQDVQVMVVQKITEVLVANAVHHLMVKKVTQRRAEKAFLWIFIGSEHSSSSDGEESDSEKSRKGVPLDFSV